MKFIAALVFLAALCHGGRLHGSEYGQNDGNAAAGGGKGGGAAKGGGAGGAGPCAGVIGKTNSTRQADCVWNNGRVDGWVEQTERAVANGAGEGEGLPK